MEPIIQSTPLNNEKKYIQELEKKIKLLEIDIAEKNSKISDIENNMKSFYVENWKTTDSDGVKGEFSGNIYWVKGEGTIFYKNRTHFEGDWNSTGEIENGELFDYSGKIIEKWVDGELIEDYECPDAEYALMRNMP